MGMFLFVLKYMYISLLLKMINGFSWPAKFMAIPFKYKRKTKKEKEITTTNKQTNKEQKQRQNKNKTNNKETEQKYSNHKK